MRRFFLIVILISMLFLLFSCGEESLEADNVGDSDYYITSDNGDSGSQADDNGDTSDSSDDSGNTVSDQSAGDSAPDKDATIGMECTPGNTLECYSGPSNTQGVGACQAGTMTCIDDGSGWGACKNEVLPQAEICSDGEDQDCDGIDQTPGNAIDFDGDGFTYCEGDCCELGSQCIHPELVNPRSFEIEGNNVDDNCNGEIDEVAATCDNGTPHLDAAMNLGQSMDLCPAGENGFGIVSAELLFANGTAIDNDGKSLAPVSYSTFTGLGTLIRPHNGASMAAISSGVTVNPFKDTEAELGNDTASASPADWYSANGNKYPTSPSCGFGTESNDPANDSVMLKLKIRAPLNAESFSFQIYFLSIEFPDYVCSTYNDFFLSLIDSSFTSADPLLQNPADKNLAMDAMKNPVGVNLAKNGLFTVCEKSWLKPDITAACLGGAELQGTGFEGHGATGWLVTRGNVVGGEEFELRLVTWDSGDHVLDSMVLLDNFTWYAATQTPGTGR
ncbi:choice-of-anchor L domain-containing protein [bacterium]|nr:choice-of-anchor L domain-containing protein [bacterium]